MHQRLSAEASLLVFFMLPAFQTYFILQTVYTKVRCPVSKLPECLPARPSTLTHLWAQLIATLGPCCFCPQSHMATHQFGIAARKSYLCDAWRHFV